MSAPRKVTYLEIFDTEYEAHFVIEGTSDGKDDAYEMLTCRTCWASVRAYAAEGHYEWHRS